MFDILGNMIKTKKAVRFLKFFWFSVFLTILVASWIGWNFGPVALWLFTILLILEITFSFDNAVINSKVLARLSPFWQKLFLTVGILFAVFVVRFILPIIIVMISGNESFNTVIGMAFNDPEKYSHTLHDAAPMIDAFGGTFLIMIGISYFMDHEKEIHWLKKTENWLTKFGNYDSFKTLMLLIVSIILYVTVDEQFHVAVLLSSIVAIVTHIALDIFSQYFSKKQSKVSKLVGGAAFASFLYLNILDASFSLDGVIGAFAITNDIILIMAGLGAGALWVRSMTVYLTRTGTLSKYLYLEHGAHWAILALGLIMIIKLYGVELSEWFTGLIGLVIIVTALISSVLEKRSYKLVKN